MTYSHDSLMEMLRDWADTARKADTILKGVPMPQPNAAALEALPVGTVIRIDTHAYVHTAAWEWVETVTGTAYTAAELEWVEVTIIYQPKGES